jgi:hypothetical protein
MLVLTNLTELIWFSTNILAMYRKTIDNYSVANNSQLSTLNSQLTDAITFSTTSQAFSIDSMGMNSYFP